MCYAGTVDDHVRQSQGGESDILNHYVTSYKSSYNQHWDGFKPRDPKLYGSGFVSNQRPVIQYSSKMDDIDNPRMKDLLEANYLSTTRQDFTPFCLPDGTEAIPSLSKTILPKKYGGQTLNSNFSSVKEKLDNALVCATPKRGPELLKNAHRGEFEEENSGYGPAFGSTTYNSSFGPPSGKIYNLFRTNLGKKEETGNTKNIRPENTITGRPDNPHLPGEPGWKTMRPIGISEYSGKYQPFTTPDGTEHFPRWTKPPRSWNMGSYAKEGQVLPDYVPVHPENTYGLPEHASEARTDDLKRKDPTEYQNVIHRSKEPSISKGTYQGLQREPPTLSERVGRRNIGPLTSSGFAENQKGHVDEQDTPSDRFVTHYMTRYYHPPPSTDLQDREGHVHFNTQPAQITTSAKEIACKYFEPQIPATSLLPALPPYQARSIIARDTIPSGPTKNRP